MDASCPYLAMRSASWDFSYLTEKQRHNLAIAATVTMWLGVTQIGVRGSMGGSVRHAGNTALSLRLGADAASRLLLTRKSLYTASLPRDP